MQLGWKERERHGLAFRLVYTSCRIRRTVSWRSRSAGGMSPHPMQFAAKTYLSSLPVHYFRETLAERYLESIQILADALSHVGFQVCQLEGAYYLFARY